MSKIGENSSLRHRIEKAATNISKHLGKKWANSKNSNVNFRAKNEKWLAAETLIIDDKIPAKGGRPALFFLINRIAQNEERRLVCVRKHITRQI